MCYYTVSRKFLDRNWNKTVKRNERGSRFATVYNRFVRFCFCCWFETFNEPRTGFYLRKKNCGSSCDVINARSKRFGPGKKNVDTRCLTEMFQLYQFCTGALCCVVLRCAVNRRQTNFSVYYRSCLVYVLVVFTTLSPPATKCDISVRAGRTSYHYLC